MLRSLLLFVAANLLGETLHKVLHLPVSGAVLGLILLFILLRYSGEVAPEVAATGATLLRILPLFFVVPGVGVMEDLPLLAGSWPVILAALLGSSIVALLVTSASLYFLDRNAARTPQGSVLPEGTS